MGNSSYSVENRSDSERSVFYNAASTTTDEIFTQNVKRMIHESMNPKDIDIREARDSEEHPNTVPIILGLDLTGSMGHIPEDLIKTGLPKLIGGIIQGGIPDPALLFVGVGDHEVDSAPLQVGQFESGDEELDMWLTRTWLEGGGGGNMGESYHLAWYFAAFYTAHDAWDKREQKGFLITIGDEPCLPTLSKSSINEIMGKSQANFSKEALLDIAREKYHVFHIHIEHGGYRDAITPWKELLGQDFIITKDYTEIPNIIKKLIIDNTSKEFNGDDEGIEESGSPKITL